MSASLTDQQLDKIIGTINDVGAFSVTDAATLLLAFTSLVVALAAARFTMHQRDVVRRAERLMIHRELLEVLWYLKGYNGTPEPEAEVHFKQLQKLRSIAESAFSIEAKNFIDGLLEKMQSLPAQKNAYENEVTPEVAAILEGLGVDPNIHDFMGIKYMEVRNYFSRGAFEEFGKLFPVKA